MRSVLVLIPGFGEPYWGHKLEILSHNYHCLTAHPSAADIHIDFKILQYSPQRSFPMDFFERHTPAHQRVSNFSLVVSTGIIGSNIYQHAPPSIAADYDYVMILLDDIEFQSPIQWGDLCMILDTPALEVDILSPCLKDPSMSPWTYMAHQPQLAKRYSRAFIKRNRCELFVYLMKASTYSTYYHHIDPENPYMWGMDLILKHSFDLQPAIVNHWVMYHHYKGAGTYRDEAVEDAERYLRKYHMTLSQASQLPDVPKAYSMNPTIGDDPHNDALRGRAKLL
jgi:hypothetical protein